MGSVGGLFSGLGGIELGLERAGWKISWLCEIDDVCRRVLKQKFNVKIYRDVRILPATLPKVDLLCGGFPCQPVSMLGRKGYTSDERWLWDEFYNVIVQENPEWILIENVQGLLTLGMDRILQDLADSGYDAEWDCLPAAAVGAPHLRYRVFLVAYASSKRTAAGERIRIFPEKIAEENEGNPFTHITSEQAAARSSILKFSSSIGHSGYTNSIARTWLDAGSEKVVAAIPPLALGTGHWRFEPKLVRMVHGISDRMDRSERLGNAVVPQLAEWIGQRILENA